MVPYGVSISNLSLMIFIKSFFRVAYMSPSFSIMYVSVKRNSFFLILNYMKFEIKKKLIDYALKNVSNTSVFGHFMPKPFTYKKESVKSQKHGNNK